MTTKTKQYALRLTRDEVIAIDHLLLDNISQVAKYCGPDLAELRRDLRMRVLAVLDTAVVEGK